MKGAKFTEVEKEVIEAIAENFDITTIEAAEKFIRQKRSMMFEAAQRGDVKVAEELKKQLGE